MTNNATQGWGSQPASPSPSDAGQRPTAQPVWPPADDQRVSSPGASVAQERNLHAAPAQMPRPAWPQPQQPPARRSEPAANRRQPPPTRQRAGCGAALVALGIVALVVLGVGIGLIGYASVARGLPLPDELQARASHFASTLIYDRNGAVLSEVGDPNFGRRTAVPLGEISQYLVDATISTEDPNFWKHPGVDPVGLMRAVYYAVKERSLSGPGGSTITQQLVKLTYLSSEKTITRKVKEAILAAEITRRYPRETILQIYLNELNYGNLAYGIQAAAETYFGKSAQDLTLAQAAMLAGLPQAPAYYDPYTKLKDADGQPGAVKRRQGEVLRLMVEHGYITPAQADAAWAEPLDLQPLTQVYDSKYPHFIQYAREQVEGSLGPELAAKGGLRIYTTLNSQIQDIAQDEVQKQTAALAKQGGHNGAAVVIAPGTGEVLALVGSAGFSNEAISGQIDMARSPRQPGSSIKPFTYLAAFEMPAAVSTKAADIRAAQAGGKSQISAIEPPGYWTPATAIMDIRTEFPDGEGRPPYVPVNYDGQEHGLVSVRTALANSYNIPAVKALEHVGIGRLRDVANRAGITTLTRNDYGLSLTLGGGEVTLLEMTAAYATLANGGTRAPVSPIACVLDAEGKLIWQGTASGAVAACAAAPRAAAVAVTPAPAERVFDPAHVYLITSILADAEARKPMFGGVANLMSLPGRQAAIKTGTTNDYHDAWAMGYTPNLAVGVWVGNADYSPMQKVAGSVGAVPIWHNVMARALADQPVLQFMPPAGVSSATVCAESGAFPSEVCPAQRQDVFAADRGPLPAAYDIWQRVRVDKATGQLATEFTPADRIEERVVALFPERYREWAAAHGYPVLNAASTYAFQPELALSAPVDGSEVADIVPVAGRIHIPEPLVWRLEYGVGPNPQGWGVVLGPLPADPAEVAERERDGALGDWDIAAAAAQHGVRDFSLRLTAYDPANMDYPVAVSSPVYVVLAAPTETPSPTPSPVETLTATPTVELTPTPLAMPGAGTATPESTLAPATATPEATPPPADTPAPTATPTPAAVPVAPTVVISAPQDGATVTGQVEILGTAQGAGFLGYLVEYAAGEQPAEPDWQPVALPATQPVSNGRLAVWQTDALQPGTYSLRLRMLDTSGGVHVAQIRVALAR